jgi:hypothetical protein
MATARGTDFNPSFLELVTISPETGLILAEVAGRLTERLDELAAAIVDRYEAEMTGAGTIPKDDAQVWVLAVMRTVIERLRDPGASTVAAQDVIEELTRDRAAHGFPVEALLRAFQVGARGMLEVIDREATAHPGTTAATLLETHDFLWEWANHAMNVVAAVHREIEVERASRDSSQRAEFVRGVLHGRIPESRIAGESRLYGLSPNAEYFTFRARPVDERDSARLELELGRSGSASARRAVVTVLDGDVAGLAPRRPRAQDALVAIGPPAPLDRAAASFAEAGEALETAFAFGLRGAVDLPSLGPLPLALADDRAAERLEVAHLGALAEHDRNGEIERTVLAVLDHDQDVRATAAELHVHPNTVRYRLNRFRELTGLDLHRTDDLIVAWWLLKRRSARSAHDAQ